MTSVKCARVIEFSGDLGILNGGEVSSTVNKRLEKIKKRNWTRR